MTLVEALHISATMTDGDARGDAMLAAVLTWKREDWPKYEALLHVAGIASYGREQIGEGVSLVSGALPQRLRTIFQDGAIHPMAELEQRTGAKRKCIFQQIYLLRQRGVNIVWANKARGYCLVDQSPSRSAPMKVLQIASVLACLVCLGGPASAQTTCPNAPSGSTVLSNTTLTVSWCSLTTDTIIGAYVYGLPSPKVPVQGVAAAGGPFGDGKTLYRGTIAGLAAGSYSVTVTDVNCQIPGQSPCTVQQESATASPPFALSVVNAAAKPAAPSNVNIQ